MKYRGVIISGLPCSGKSVLAKKLEQEYGWSEFSFGKMWRDKWRIAYPQGHVSFEDWWRSTSIEDNRQVNIEARKILEAESKVVDSRYSAFYCKDLPYLRVFMFADLETRAERNHKREDALFKEKAIKSVRSKEALIRILEQREKDELKTGMDIFGEDYRNPKHYHLTLDTSHLTIRQEFNALRAIIDTTN